MQYGRNTRSAGVCKTCFGKENRECKLPTDHIRIHREKNQRIPAEIIWEQFGDGVIKSFVFFHRWCKHLGGFWCNICDNFCQLEQTFHSSKSNSARPSQTMVPLSCEIWISIFCDMVENCWFCSNSASSLAGSDFWGQNANDSVPWRNLESRENFSGLWYDKNNSCNLE